MRAFSLNDSQRILTAAEKSGLTVDECVRQLRTAGRIKANKERMNRWTGSWAALWDDRQFCPINDKKEMTKNDHR